MMTSSLHDLEHGQLIPFSDWPHDAVPKVAAGVYTIWDDQQFVYVGMSGRTLTEQQIIDGQSSGKKKGLWTRLDSHASGRRSGDQFCVYVSDRFVLPTLDEKTIAEISTGAVSLDSITRDYIRDRLSFRFTITIDGTAAFELEREVQRGALAAGRPFLNPL